MKKFFRYVAITTALAICLGAGSAWAKDAIKATVTANGFTFVENGNPLSPGTYAVGTLKIYMIVSAYEWPETLGSVQLNLAVQEGQPSPPTKYTVPIRLRQAGGDLVLAPNPVSFNVDGLGWYNSSTINVTVPQAIIDDPVFNQDGTQLLANLQIEPTLPARHLDTVTTVKIYAMLVHPASCLRTVAFISNQGLDVNLTESTTKLELRYDWRRISGTPTCMYKDKKKDGAG